VKFYVYELVLVPDGTVCYVGKGSGRRMWNHRRYALQPPATTQAYLYRKLSELLQAGKDFQPRKVFETDSEQEALQKESELIRHYGLEKLFNCGMHTGPLLTDIDEARRTAMSKARREYVAKLQAETGQSSLPEVRAKISASNTGKQVSEETRRKLSTSISTTYQGHFSRKHRKKLSKAAKARGFSRAAIDAMRKANLGGHRDTTKARLSRKQRYYVIVSPQGIVHCAQSNGIVTLLKSLRLPISNFYRAIKLGTYKGWKVTVRNSSRCALGQTCRSAVRWR
jgi:hypothetical protein